MNVRPNKGMKLAMPSVSERCSVSPATSGSWLPLPLALEAVAKSDRDGGVARLAAEPPGARGRLNHGVQPTPADGIMRPPQLVPSVRCQ